MIIDSFFQAQAVAKEAASRKEMSAEELKAALEKNRKETANTVQLASYCFSFFLLSIEALNDAKEFVDFVWVGEWDPSIDVFALYRLLMRDTGIVFSRSFS